MENQIVYGNLAFAIRLAACIKKAGFASKFLLTNKVSDETALEELMTDIEFLGISLIMLGKFIKP